MQAVTTNNSSSIYIRHEINTEFETRGSLILLGCYTVSLRLQLQTFRRGGVPSSSGPSSPLRITNHRNVGNYNPNDTVSQPTRPDSVLHILCNLLWWKIRRS